MTSKAKSDAMDRENPKQDGERGKPIVRDGELVPDTNADRDSSGAYDACMKAYRWMSQRYRRTLDELAK